MFHTTTPPYLVPFLQEGKQGGPGVMLAADKSLFVTGHGQVDQNRWPIGDMDEELYSHESRYRPVFAGVRR
jgi:hypothetical protein